MGEILAHMQLRVDREAQRLTLEIPYGEGVVSALKLQPHEAAQLAKSLIQGAIYCGWKPDALPPMPIMDIDNSPPTERKNHETTWKTKTENETETPGTAATESAKSHL